MTDFAERRRVMVDTQIRPSDVTKFPIIEAMLSVPREDFVPSSLRERAYVGDNITLAPERVILEPRTLAKMLDALELSADALVLDIGAGMGYSAAVIARMCAAVVAVEEAPDFAADAEEALMAQGTDNVVLHQGPLAHGAGEHGPYDAIVIQGAVEVLPDAISEQLKPGGKIVCMFACDSLGEVRLGHKADRQISWRMVFNAHAPTLPGFSREQIFSL